MSRSNYDDDQRQAEAAREHVEAARSELEDARDLAERSDDVNHVTEDAIDNARKEADIAADSLEDATYRGEEA